jgi:hypothetical protein
MNDKTHWRKQTHDDCHVRHGGWAL